tara:strand:- start:686 stop:1645 length:960 start_codon:yes stop_codon:yes gene_type:complete
MGFTFDGSVTGYTTENATEFYTKVLLGSKVAKTMRVIANIKSSQKLPQSEFGIDILQADQDCVWNSGGNDVTISQRTITPVSVMINEEFCVKKLEPNFTQKILSPGGIYEDVPAEIKLFNLVGMSVAKVIELALVRGEAGGADPIASLNLFDGILEVCSDDIAAGDIPAGQQLTGVLDQANIIASFRAMHDALDLDSQMNLQTQKNWKIYCSPQAKVNYNRAFQAANGALPYNKDFNQDFLDNTGIEIIDFAGFDANPAQAVLTREGNFWIGTDVEGEESELSLELGSGSEAKTLFLSGVFKMGVQSEDPSIIVTNNIT